MAIISFLSQQTLSQKKKKLWLTDKKKKERGIKKNVIYKKKWKITRLTILMKTVCVVFVDHTNLFGIAELSKMEAENEKKKKKRRNKKKSL